MANQWFRLYAEILSDSKVQILTESLRWRYVALLCLKCNGGYENTPDDEIALSIRITVDEWIATKTEFIKRRLLNEDGSINGWDKRQYISDLKDPTAAERQKRYRDNKRNDRNDTVTSRLPEQNRADTEQNRTEITPAADAPTKQTKKKSSKTSIPGDFSISESIRSWYAKQGYKENIDAHLVAFIDKAIANSYAYADWDAAFRNAIRDDWAKLRVNGQQKPAYNGQSRDWSDDYWRGYKVIG